MVLLLNGLRLARRIGNGVVVVVVALGAVVPPPAKGKPTGMAVLFVKNGPWLRMELEGEDEFKESLRWRGEVVGEGDAVGLLVLIILSLRIRARGSRGEAPILVCLGGRMKRSAIDSLWTGLV